MRARWAPGAEKNLLRKKMCLGRHDQLAFRRVSPNVSFVVVRCPGLEADRSVTSPVVRYLRSVPLARIPAVVVVSYNILN